jgi:hypothetical protein
LRLNMKFIFILTKLSRSGKFGCRERLINRGENHAAS